MRKAFSCALVVFLLMASLAVAQQLTDVEAQIKAAMPYAAMVREIPGLTLQDYNEAVRQVARERAGSAAAPVAPAARLMSPPSVVGADGTYLGVLSSNPYDPNSTSNPYGKYGSPYSPTSVNNPYSKYGSPYSPDSATNPYAVNAPKIVNPYAGRLSANPYAPDSTSNPYGKYGSPFSPSSINNPYGRLGNPYNPSSVMNPYVVAPMRPLPALPSLPKLPSLPGLPTIAPIAPIAPLAPLWP